MSCCGAGGDLSEKRLFAGRSVMPRRRLAPEVRAWPTADSHRDVVAEPRLAPLPAGASRARQAFWQQQLRFDYEAPSSAELRLSLNFGVRAPLLLTFA
jgi:hypothetical protein